MDRTEIIARLRGSAYEAFIAWVPSPPQGEPLAERRLGRFTWWRWLRDAFPWILSFLVLATGMASIPRTELFGFVPVPTPLLAVAIALPVAVARRYALLGWRLCALIALILAVASTGPREDNFGPLPILLVWVWLGLVFLVGARHDRWTLGWVWVVTVALLSTGLDTTSDVPLIVGVTALVFIADLVRSRRIARRALEHETEVSQLEKARRAVLEERTRIARDLHDVVAHHMSMVAVQAESAPYRLPDLSEESRAEFASISDAAREALTEIRSLLAVLRKDDDQAQRSPQPGLDQLDELCDGARRAGLQVSLSVVGQPSSVRPAVGLSSYRILQESLANAARHARGAEVDVEVRHDADAIRLTVVTMAPTEPVSPGPPGHGISGMRERAVVVGGTLHAGPLPGGGFVVSAMLPVREPVKEPS